MVMYYLKSIVLCFDKRYAMYVFFYDMNFTSDVLLLHSISVIPRKIFKAYYGFRVLSVFPFPSAGH